MQIQWEINGGKCGVCGDRFDGPRDNEIGGKYANGIIVQKYKPGATIDVTVHITANHKGWFEFRLCRNDNPQAKIDQECMDKNLLQIKEAGRIPTRWNLDFTNAFKKTLHVILPADVRCRACVIQWKYNTGNSWGVDPDGRGCVGCGPQEQFYGCADIAIGHDDVAMGKPNEVPVTIPDGDVDERTWDGGETEEQKDDCDCKCSSAALVKARAILIAFIAALYLACH